MAVIAVLSIDESDGFAYIIPRWLRAEPRIHHIGHFPTASVLYEMVSLLRPHAVVMDARLPGADPFEEMRRTLTDFPDVRFVVMANEPADAAVAFSSGAAAVVDKDYGGAKLAAAVVRAVEGSQPAATVESKPRRNHASAAPITDD
jgi:DNA-binding NarL/FixJ family response regulator